MENQIVIKIPEGKTAIQETDKDGNIIIKYVDAEPIHSKSWEEFCANHPYATGEFYLLNTGTAQNVFSKDEIGKRSHWPTCMASKEDAEGILALIKLTRLHDEWVGDWKHPEGEIYYGIRKFNDYDSYKVAAYQITYSLLNFPTEKMAREFLDCFKDLITKAKKFI